MAHALVLPFAKAAIAGGAAGDLLAPLPTAAGGVARKVQVAGYTRGGNFVAPHQATRHVAVTPRPYDAKISRELHAPAETTHRGLRVTWPDEAHARLFHLGDALRRGQEPDAGEVHRLFHHFHGHVESDEGGGRPFTRVEHVRELALDYADPEWGEAALMGHQSKNGRYEANDILSPDGRGEYFRRGTAAAFSKALEFGRILFFRKDMTWTGTSS